MRKRLTGYLICVVLITQLVGCATGAKAPGMTVLDSEVSVSVNPILASNIDVGSVTGGKKTNPLWKSNISTDEFKLALESSLAAVGYRSNHPNYVLDAELLEVKQPFFGFDFTVTSRVNYKLKESTTKTNVFDETITSSYTAGISDAFLGVERLRLANEGSIKENIKILIDRLANLVH